MTADSLQLEQEYEAEFVPILLSKAARGCRLDTYLVAEDKEALVSSTELDPNLSASSVKGEDVYALLSRRVRVDLSAWRGQQVSFKWVVRDTDSNVCPTVSVEIGQFRLLPKRRQPGKRPSILFVCSDTHRYDYSLEGRGPELMPRLSDFGRHAVVYHRAFSNASWTLPSVVSTLTGVSPRFHRSGQRIREGPAEELMKDPLPPGQFVLDWGERSFVLTAYPQSLSLLTEHLRKQGYETAMVLSNPLMVLSGVHADGQDVVIDTNVVPGSVVNRAAFQILQNARQDCPLFLWVHYMDVHHFTQWHFKKKYPDKSPREARAEWVSCYEEAVREADDYLGQLLDQWDECVGLEESLVAFFADHGEHLLDPGRYTVGHGQSMDEILLHVPLVVKYPDFLQRNERQVNTPVSLVDLTPTALDLAGVEWDPDVLDGISLLGIEGTDRLRTIYADYQLYGNELSSARQEPWKLILNLTEETRQLVNAHLPRNARGELAQVIQDDTREEALEAAYQDYVKRGDERSADLKFDQLVDQAEVFESLEALGYLSPGAGRTP